MPILPRVLHHKDSAGTGRPGILWLGEAESLICNSYLRVAARTIVRADPSWDSLPCCWDAKHPTNNCMEKFGEHHAYKTHECSKGLMSVAIYSQYHGQADEASKKGLCEPLRHSWQLQKLLLLSRWCGYHQLGATRGVTVSMSAFLACHQGYCSGSSLAWGLNLRAVVFSVFWSSSPGVFSGYSGFLPSFIGFNDSASKISSNKCDFNSVKLDSWAVPSYQVARNMTLARDQRSMCCTWFAHDCTRATWSWVLETVRGALRRL